MTPDEPSRVASFKGCQMVHSQNSSSSLLSIRGLLKGYAMPQGGGGGRGEAGSPRNNIIRRLFNTYQQNFPRSGVGLGFRDFNPQFLLICKESADMASVQAQGRTACSLFWLEGSLIRYAANARLMDHMGPSILKQPRACPFFKEAKRRLHKSSTWFDCGTFGFGYLFQSATSENSTRYSSREVRTRVPFFSVVYFSRGTLPQKRGEKGTTRGPSPQTP